MSRYVERERAALAAREAEARLQPQQRRAIRLDPNFGKFERHTTGFGLRILQMYGFRGALGKYEQGVTAPVNVVVRPKNAGLGYVTEAKNEELDPALRDAGKTKDGEKEKKSAFERQLEALWRKDPDAAPGGRGGKRAVRTVDEILADRARATVDGGAEVADTEVIVHGTASGGAALDMKAISQLMASSDALAGAGASAVGLDVAAELSALCIGLAPATALTPAAAAAEGPAWAQAFRRNVRLSADLAEAEVMSAERRRRAEAAALTAMRAKHEELAAVADAEADAAARLDRVYAVLDRLHTQLSVPVPAPTQAPRAGAAMGGGHHDGDGLGSGGGFDTGAPRRSVSGEVEVVSVRAAPRGEETVGAAREMLRQLKLVRTALDTLVYDYPRDFVHLSLAGVVTDVARPLWAALLEAWDPLGLAPAATAARAGRVSTPALCDELAEWRALLTVTQQEVRARSSKAPGGALLPSFRALARDDVYGGLLRATLVPRLASVVAAWAPPALPQTHALALTLAALRPLCGEALFDGDVAADLVVPRLAEAWTEGEALDGARADAPLSTSRVAAADAACAWAIGYPHPWTFAFLLPLPLPTRDQLAALPAVALPSAAAAGTTGAGVKPRPPLLSRSVVPPLAAAVREALGRWLQRWPAASESAAAADSAACTLGVPLELVRLVAPAALEAVTPWVTGVPFLAAAEALAAGRPTPAPPAGETATWPPSEAARFCERAITPRLAAALRASLVVRGAGDFTIAPESAAATVGGDDADVAGAALASGEAPALAALACQWAAVLGVEATVRSVLAPHLLPQLLAALYEGLAAEPESEAAAAGGAAALGHASQWLCAWRATLPAAVAESSLVRPVWAAAAELLEALAAPADTPGRASTNTAALLTAFAAIERASGAAVVAPADGAARAGGEAAWRVPRGNSSARVAGGDQPGVGADDARPLLLREVLGRIAEAEGMLFAPDRRRGLGKDGKVIYSFGEHVPVLLDGEVAWTRSAAGAWEPVALQEIVARAKRFNV
jgi:hypothetical protein